MRDFKDYSKVILAHEGGYIHDLDDPGGETNFGICKRQYPYLDIKNLTKEKASEIYYKDYWLPMNLNLLPNDELKLHLFDVGVNAGIRTAIKLLQSMLIITSDGVIGNDTVKAVSSYDGDIVKDYMSVRKNYYQQLTVKNPKLLKFLKGWITRVNTTKF